jgi:hypothetical protein
MDATLSAFFGIVGAILFACGILFGIGAALVLLWQFNPIAFGIGLGFFGAICYGGAAMWERG